ncbi:cellulose synthase subunit BcsC-related outer membrane protein [Pulveribacter sp.]|uniref:cellulose synthase subunit BcsC-related outer membrane protein n=1 Tax=Pulveribacter sp. TaxID=2678893 RepID=UPI002899F646|nr:cellulose synthase subunit BcsC-related outer membrane protein [Pulveribacter sp.]
MKQRRPAAMLPCLIALAACLQGTAALAEEPSGSQQELLRNAQMWASRNRLDLARQSIDKLLALQPDSAQGLAILGDVALRENRPADAQRILGQLRARHPGSSATADLATLTRIYGEDREKLARMRLLARAGRKPEAAALARELFPQGPPAVGGLAAEYHQVVGSEGGSATKAAAALEQLYATTGDADYRLAQLELQLDRGASALALARQFEQLAANASANPQRLRDLWRRALGQLDGTAAAVPRLQAYLKRYPEDQPMAEQLAALQAPASARVQGVPAQGGSGATAQAGAAAASARRAAEADHLGAQGLEQLRQGQHARAQELFAQAQHLSPQQKWQDLLATARFWGLLRQAEDGAKAQKLDEAASLATQALRLQPGQADALALLAGVRAQQGDDGQAQTLYERALRVEPANVDALQGLASLYVRSGREPQALALLESAQRDHPAQARQMASARAGILAEQAEKQRQEQQVGTALRLLEEAVALTPDDPWLRHRLARLYLQLEQPREALGVMDQGIAAHADNADMRYARALIRSATDDDAGAVADLEHVSPEERSDSMRNLLRSATVHATVAQAAAPQADAPALLAQAERLAGNDPDLLAAVANAWFRRSQPEQAVAVFDRLAARSPSLPPAVRLQQAVLLGRAANDGRLVSLLPILLAEPGWTPEQSARLAALQDSHLERRIEAAMAGGDTALAGQLARSPLYGAKVQPPQRQAYVRGRLLLAAGDYAGAAEQLEQALHSLSDEPDLRLALADALARQGRPVEARTQAQWLQEHLAPDDVGAQLALLRLWQRMSAMEEATVLAQRLLEQYPADSDVLLHAARLERAQDRYAQALVHFRQAQALEAGSPQASEKIARDIQAIEARRQAWVEVGMERLQKSSTSGISSLRGWEIPAVAWMPRGYDGHHFLHVDRVVLDAGPLPASAQDADTYGQVAAWPSSAYPLAPGVSRGEGANVGFGYRGRGIEWDVGAIGIGMPVTNLVGSISRSEWSEDFSWRAELSRRPLTGGLLPYAGARDPITGQVWGGVVATGVSGRISSPIRWGSASYGTSLSASYALLQGRNVRDNTRLQVRAAIDRDFLRTEHQSVNLGAALSWWRYAHDLSEYSWGHGGYYSPRNYLSLSLPVEWGGRRGAFSWLLRGSLSVSRSSSRASGYYPGSAALQAQAETLGRTPFYPGASSSGTGRALRASVEYQATPRWALGAQLSLDRAAYYAPTTVMLYMRYALGPVLAPLQDRPRPVQTYSSF